MLIVLMSLWLPLQSLAGVLVHCERLSDSATIASTKTLTGLAPAEPLADNTHNAPETADTADCHGAPAMTSTFSADKHDQSDKPDCFHCNGSCHGAKTFSMLSTQPQISLSATDSFLNLQQAAADGYAASPHRPPCKFTPV